MDSKSANIWRLTSIKLDEEDILNDERFRVFKRLASLDNDINYDKRMHVSSDKSVSNFHVFRSMLELIQGLKIRLIAMYDAESEQKEFSIELKVHNKNLKISLFVCVPIKAIT